MRNEMVCSKRNESGHVKIKSSRYSMPKKKKKKKKNSIGVVLLYSLVLRSDQTVQGIHLRTRINCLSA